MFDLGFLELMICGVIALLVLGPERLPGAARAAGEWIGRARRMTRQFSDELDRQVKADEIRAQLRLEESEVGYEDIQRNVQEALDEAKKYEHLILPDAEPRQPSASRVNPAQAVRSRQTTPVAENPAAAQGTTPPAERGAPPPASAAPDSLDTDKDSPRQNSDPS